MLDMEFFKNKKVLVTGHTGFKGSWLCKMLIRFGANVIGYSLDPPTDPSLFKLAKIADKMNSVIGDIRDYESLKNLFDETKPEIVVHLAAQPIVREGYKNPLYTYETNVVGTVNILECIRLSNTVKSFLNVTTDKVYENKEWVWGYRENDSLNGYDPYSNSKSCSELITSSYIKSFFYEKSVSVSTARAGNVIGGGDFANDRIIPDCIRAAINEVPITVRNPFSIRPYQHVLEPLYVYLLILSKQFEANKYSGCYNVGPDESDNFTNEMIVDLFVRKWGGNLEWIDQNTKGPHESSYLKLDNSKIKNTFKWKPRWDIECAIQKTIEWTKCWINGGDIGICMDNQIDDLLKYNDN